MQYGSKSYKVDDLGVIYYLTIYYLQLILLGSFAFSKIQVSVYIDKFFKVFMVLPSFWFQIIRYICNFNDKVIAISPINTLLNSKS